MKTLIAIFLTMIPVCAAPPGIDMSTETIHCGTLVYGDNKTAICFAEAFLTDAAKETGLNISPKFVSIGLAKDEVFTTPLCVFTGQGDFNLKDTEKLNLRRYLEERGIHPFQPRLFGQGVERRVPPGDLACPSRL